MFGELALPVFKVEMLLPGYVARADFQPKGDLLIFLNDQRYSVVRCDNVELFPVMSDGQVRGMKQPMMALGKRHLSGIAVLEAERAAGLQLLAAKRPFVLYTDAYAIQGNLHVNADARDDDVFDGTRTFYAMSDAAIYPLRTLRKAPTRKVPVLAINQHLVIAYHPHHPGGE
ncbi:MAG: hypothetical protein KC425_03055 [Anaerolineales bacterium]|nr:hypothetical protein [Anaerolineales bacterium]